MEFTTVQLKVPKEMQSFLITDEIQDELIRNAMILYPYIKNATISHGRAAEILGIRKLELIDLYGELGFPYFDIDIEDVEEDIATYKKLKEQFI